MKNLSPSLPAAAGEYDLCTRCWSHVPVGLRCGCELIGEQEQLDQILEQSCEEAPVALAAAPAPPRDTLLQRDWPAIVTILLVALALTFGAQFLRLQRGGEETLRSWSPPDRMEVSQ